MMNRMTALRALAALGLAAATVHAQHRAAPRPTEAEPPQGNTDTLAPRINRVSPLPAGRIVDNLGLAAFEIGFTESVLIPAGSVRVRDLSGDGIGIAAQWFDDTTNTLHLQLDRPVRADVIDVIIDYTLTDLAGNELDGEVLNPMSPTLPTGDGVRGGTAVFRYEVLQGDANRDGVVDLLDGVAIGTALGASAGTPGYDPLADLNSDGVINVLDVAIWAAGVGNALPAVSATRPVVSRITPDPAGFLEGDLGEVRITYTGPIAASSLDRRDLFVLDGAGRLTPASSAGLADDGVTVVFGFDPPLTRCDRFALNLSGALIDPSGALAVRPQAAPVLDGLRPSTSPVFEAHPGLTADQIVTLAGTVLGASQVRVIGPEVVYLVPVVGDVFIVEVELPTDQVHTITAIGLSPCGVAGLVATTQITRDTSAPHVFIDFPLDGQEITPDRVTIAGRVSDEFSGLDGLTVTVNGLPAAVGPGPGGQGSFVRMDVPLTPGPQLISVTATDRLGNARTESIQLTRVEVPPGSPTIEALAGDGQAGPVRSGLDDPIEVLLRGPSGAPLANKVVTFTVVRNNGRLAATRGGTAAGSVEFQTLTDDQGVARAYWGLGNTAGPAANRVVVTSRDMIGTVFFCADGVAAPAGRIVIGDHNNQRGEAGAPLAWPLTAYVTDGDAGNPAAGVPLTFTVTRNSGLFANGLPEITVPTGSDGRARATLTLGTEPGLNTVRAEFEGNPGLPATFNATGLARVQGQPTTLTGLVLDNGGRPIGGALATLSVVLEFPAGPQPIILGPVESGLDGRFVFDSSLLPPAALNTTLPGGPAKVLVSGVFATTLGGEPITRPWMFPYVGYEVMLVEGAANTLQDPVWLPELDPANEVPYDGTQDVVLTVAGVEGLEFRVRAGSMTLEDGTRPTTQNPEIIRLNQVHFDEVPMPLPDGNAVPFAWTLQPKNARFDPPVEITLPNMTGEAPGTIVQLLQWNNDTADFQTIGTGKVAADGSVIESESGSGIRVAGWGGWTPPPPPTGSVGLVPEDLSLNPLLAETWAHILSLGMGTVAIQTGCLASPCEDRYAITHMDRFLSGQGGEIRYDGDSQAGRDFQALGKYQAERQRLINELRVRARDNNTSEFPFPFDRQNFDFYSERIKTQGYYAIGGFNGELGAEVVDVAIDNDANTVTARVRYRATDTYQFDLNDATRTPLPARIFNAMARDLQLSGFARPFVTVIEFEETITESIPEQELENFESFAASDADQDFEWAGINDGTSVRIGSVSSVASPDGFFLLEGVPVTNGQVAVRYATVVDGEEFYGRSVFVNVEEDQYTPLWEFTHPFNFVFGQVQVPSPVDLSIAGDALVLEPGQQTQLIVTGQMSDGTLADLTLRAEGTTYRSSNPAIAGVGQNGLITANARGTAFITASNQGNSTTRRIDVTESIVSTTIVGHAQFEDGSPAAGAEVTLLVFGGTTTVSSDGVFSLPVQIPTADTQNLTITATLAVGEQQFLASVSGLTPTSGFTDAGVLTLRPLCDPSWAGGLFCLLGLNGTVYAAVTWDDGTGEALYVGGSLTVASCATVANIARWDGSAWSSLGTGMNGPVEVLAVFDDGSGPALYAGGSFNQAGGQTVSNIARWDGASWSPLGSGVNSRVDALEVFDDGSGPALYAGGVFTQAGGNPASRIARWDGASWSPLGSGVNSRVDALEVFDDGSGPALYAGGWFTQAGGQAAMNIARWDGASWSPLGSGLGSGMSDWVYALTVFDDGSGPALYAGGRFNTAGGQTAWSIARWNGSTWSQLGSGFGGSALTAVQALAVFNDGSGPALYAGGIFTTAGGSPANRIARWDGASWSPLGTGMDDWVYALTVFDDGSGPALYAGGSFRTAGGQAANHVARWKGSAWSRLGSGVSSSVLDLTVFDDGSGPALYVGGGFTQVGESPANRIARWDGASWSPLGTGLSGDSFPAVSALTVFDDGSGPALYAGGRFTQAGGQAANNIARWNGTDWSRLGSGVGNFSVSDLTVFDDGSGPALYAGGRFTQAGGQTVNNIARWNGSAWSPLIAPNGTRGVNGDVYALKVFDDGSGPALYAGGEFYTAGGQAASLIARWDGASWSPLGSGIHSSSVRALAVFDDGSGPALYAGGNFTQAGGQTVSNIARWDGASWSPLGLGMNDSVFALEVIDDGSGPALYAGGYFTQAGGSPASHVARWDGASWSPLGSGMNNAVFAIDVFDDGSGPALYAGGGFTIAGGNASAYIAKWSRDCSDRSTTLLAGGGSGRFQPFSALRPGLVHEPVGGRRMIDRRRLAASDADRGVPTSRGSAGAKPGVREASRATPDAAGSDPVRQRADGSPRRYIAEARSIRLAEPGDAPAPIAAPDPLTNARGDRAEVRVDLKFGVPRGYVLSGAEARAMGTLGGAGSGPIRWLGDEVLVGWADGEGGDRGVVLWTAADGLLDLNAVVRDRLPDWGHRITGLRGVLPGGSLLVDLEGLEQPGVLGLRVFERLEGDLNADGVIDQEDLSLIVQLLQARDPAGDLNGDGAVNAGDVAVVVQRLGSVGRELVPVAGDAWGIEP